MFKSYIHGPEAGTQKARPACMPPIRHVPAIDALIASGRLHESESVSIHVPATDIAPRIPNSSEFRIPNCEL